MISTVARVHLTKGSVKKSVRFWNSLADLASRFGIGKVESDTFHPWLFALRSQSCATVASMLRLLRRGLGHALSVRTWEVAVRILLEKFV